MKHKRNINFHHINLIWILAATQCFLGEFRWKYAVALPFIQRCLNEKYPSLYPCISTFFFPEADKTTMPNRSKQLSLQVVTRYAPHWNVNKLQSCFMLCSKLFCCLLASAIGTRFVLNIICCTAVSWCHANQRGYISTWMPIVLLLPWWLDYHEMCFKADGNPIFLIYMVQKSYW